MSGSQSAPGGPEPLADPGQVPVLVLAGGLGTRLRPLTATLPKVLVPSLGRPFLEHVLRDLMRGGASRFVLSVGYLAEQVQRSFGDGTALGCEIRYVEEERPLGTGGAVRRALPLLADVFVVVNGDTLLELDLPALLGRHREAGQPVTLAVARVPDRGRYGAVRLEDGLVVQFEEKRPGAGPGWINGGVSVMTRGLLQGAPPDPFSMERDWLPRFTGRIAAFEAPGYFVDMGTHETLATLDRELEVYLRGRGAKV